MVYRCVSECASRSFLLAARLTADESKHDVKMTSRTTEQHLYGKPDRKRKAKWNLFLEIFSVKIA